MSGHLASQTSAYVPPDLADILPLPELKWSSDHQMYYGPCPLCDQTAFIEPNGAGHSFDCRSGCEPDAIRAGLVAARRAVVQREEWRQLLAKVRDFIASATTPAMWKATNEKKVAGCGVGGTATVGHDVETFRQTCRGYDCEPCAPWKIGTPQLKDSFVGQYGSMNPPLFGDDDSPIYYQAIRHRQDPDDPPEIRELYRTEEERFEDRARAARKKTGAEWLRAKTRDGLSHFFTETNVSKDNRFPVWELSRADARRLYFGLILVPLYLEAKPRAAVGSPWALPKDKPRGHTGRKKIKSIKNGNLGPIIDARTNAALDQKLGDSKARLNVDHVAEIATPLYVHNYGVAREEDEIKALEDGTFDPYALGG